jgi:predicted secreted protein
MAVFAKNPTVAIQHSSDGGTTYIDIPGAKAFDIGQISAEDIDATDFDSEGNFKEFINGYLEANEGSILCNYPEAQAATHTALRTARDDGTVEKFRAIIGHETTTFDALVKGASTPVRNGTLIETTYTIKLTGAPTYAQTA